MTPIYTRRGDDGTTGFIGEGRLPKNDPRMEALGAIDEASAATGLARAAALLPDTRQALLEIQRGLYSAMAEAAASPENLARFRKIGPAEVENLEAQIARLESSTNSPGGFILPGDTLSSAALSLARAVVRRAERRLVDMDGLSLLEGSSLLPWFNRLSSLLFVLELVEAQAGTSAGPTMAKGSTV